MEIIRKTEIKESLRCEDLEEGEVFMFLDEDMIHMICSNYFAEFVICLETGIIKGTVSEFSDRPIRRLKAQLVIED